MKKIILLFLSLVSIGSFAQEIQKPVGGKGKSTPKLTAEQRAQKSVDKLDGIVTLSAEQKTSIYALALTRSQKVDAIRTTYKGQADKKEQRKTEIKEARKTYREATKALLTEEQKTKLKAYHKANKPKKNIKSAAETPVEDIIPEVEDAE